MSAIELATCVAAGDAAGVRRILAESESPQVLLSAKVGLNGATLLHMAASHCFADVVAELIDGGADPNVLDAERNAPLAYIPAGDESEEAQRTKDALLESGAVDDPDYFHMNQPKPNDEQQADFIDKRLLINLFTVFLLPFVVLLVYNGLYFCLWFVTGTCVFYFICAGYFVSSVTLRPPWYHPSPGEKQLGMIKMPDEWRGLVHNPKKNLGLAYEDVEFPSASGNYTLRGWFVPPAADAVPQSQEMAIVFLHGGGRDRRTWLRHLPLFAKRGYTCLLFDFREHGTSDGAKRGLSFGMAERFDALGAAAYMKQQRGFKYVCAIGTSMGGSTAIMAAALDEKLIDFVVAENPLLTCAHLQKEHIANLLGGYTRHTKLGGAAFAAFQRTCSSWLNLRVGNKPSKRCQSMHVVHRIAPRPVMLMHGTYDSVIPHQHSHKLYELAKEPKALWIAPGGFHTGLYDAFPKEFENRLFGFIERHYPGRPAVPRVKSPLTEKPPTKSAGVKKASKKK